MGSKRWMLQNGLGELLDVVGRDAIRFVDLFAGSGAVAVHVAQNFSIPVLAFDLQYYSAILTGAVIQRKKAIPWKDIWKRWYSDALGHTKKCNLPHTKKVTRQAVQVARNWCEEQADLPITRAYGGYYFSPQQALWIDTLLTYIPAKEPVKTVALAALIKAASRCAAAPGHTAQPFQPTRSSKSFIQEAWSKDIIELTKESFSILSNCYAKEKGCAEVSDANKAAHRLRAGDLVFIDPPYSSVHYSRFYHVLESIAHGTVNSVSGSGRYPELSFRPRSQYSLKSKSREALADLLSTIARKGAKAIVTFPAHKCSNGLSGDIVCEIARKYFQVEEKSISSNFSTLGGTNSDSKKRRSARQDAKELILTLTPY